MPTLKTNSLAPFDASNCESRANPVAAEKLLRDAAEKFFLQIEPFCGRLSP
jgi:hypothetical protein